MQITSIYRDETLYGHALISFPPMLWAFSQGDFCLSERPDPGSLRVLRQYIIARQVAYTVDAGRRVISRTQTIVERPMCDLIELVVRRILGSCATPVAFLVCLPIGFVAKITHLAVRKLAQVWNNADLFGHALTSAPSKCYQWTTVPLSWHLRADGTDRRADTIVFKSGKEIKHKPEYQLVPFELFECAYRGVLGVPSTLAAGVVSPIGFALKCVHLLIR